MSENLILQLAVLLKNAISLLAFTILAIIFHKWWVVFFAILFLTTTEKEKEE